MRKAFTTKPQYYHFCPTDQHGKFLGKGGITVCIIPQEKGYKIGHSICSHEDDFCEKIGRGRAFSSAIHNPMVFNCVLGSREAALKVAKYYALEAINKREYKGCCYYYDLRKAISSKEEEFQSMVSNIRRGLKDA